MKTINKMLLKKYLQVFDTIEIKTMDPEEMANAILFECSRHEIECDSAIIQWLLSHLFESENLVQLEEGIELSQSISIFSRSKDQSITEALALLESIMHKKDIRLFISNHLRTSFSLETFSSLVTPLLMNSIMQSQCLILHHQQAEFHPVLIHDIDWILHQNDKVCSDCLKIHYTKDLYALRPMEYRNQDHDMIPYQNKKRILELFPQKGVPVDRDETKELQTFFKDCLFNEFQHKCCICGINIPQLLIASHIKPFRDCGHILEAMDANNGLLLCRNHDYLFDQGYLSFDDKGKILISKEIKGKESLYNLDEHFQLSACHMTSSRKLFFEYHRTLFKENDQ